MMEKTSLQWFIEQLPIRMKNYLREEIVKAEEMERNQIMNSWDDGYEKGRRDRMEKVTNPVGNSEIYYDMLYKKDK